MRRLYLPVLLFGSAIGSLSAASTYYVHNLVSDMSGLADHVDSNLVNPWGTAFSAGSPFWIANNGTGTSTLYNGEGVAIPLVVNIPSPAGTTVTGKVTGVMFNGNQSAFMISGQTPPFLFCTEDGTIAGWSSAVDKTNAKILINNSTTGAQYKGCALGGTAAAPLLYAADFANNKIDVWDANLQPVQGMQFTNPMVPTGFAPFNIQNLGGTLYVAYAPQPTNAPSMGGGGAYVSYPTGGTTTGGYVASFTMSGTLMVNMSGQSSFNYPWGMAIAPATFGDFANALLVGNFGNGNINAFNPTTGAMMGTLNKVDSSPVAIDGLWSLNFGNGKDADSATLYFTAGILGQVHGLLGSIQGAPAFSAAQVLNGASFDNTIAPNSFVTIKGGALAATTRTWGSSDFVNNTLPTALDGVSVSINGEAAYVNYISPTQINILVPSDVPPGPVQIQVTNNGVASATVSATMLAVSPAFFTFGPPNAAGNHYIAALHADFSQGGPPNYVTGVTSTPFKEGETIILYGNGFGPTSPATPKGQLVMTALPLATLPTVTIGGLSAQVQFAGISATGLYQFNVVVPTGLTPGTTANIDVPVVITAGGAKTQSNAVISVVNPTK
jgi:uncharacterized protein (TIGR03118 family)